MRKALRGEAARFLSILGDGNSEECIIWPFSRIANGYGTIRINGKAEYVHRLICERAHGPAPTSHHQASHSCGKGHLGCINSKHLSWKTPKENHADRIAHGTSNRGETHGQAKLTEADVREIRRLRGKISQKMIASMFGVNGVTVCKVQKRNLWGWLP